MAKFGGASQFGGGSQFGGAVGRGLRYWRALRALDPPGVYSEDDDSLHADLQRADGKALGDYGLLLVDRFALESFPHSAEETLDQWEELYQISPGLSATIAERQAVVAARWRSALSSSPPHLRMLLAELLNSSTAFNDACDDDDVSFRYTQIAGNGAIGENTVEQTLSVGAAAQGDWTATEQNCPRNLVELVDRADDAWFSALVKTWGGNNDTAAGVALYKDARHAICFEMEQTAGTIRLRGWTMRDGVKTFRSTTVVAPALPFWLQVARVGGEYLFKYGADLDTVTQLDLVLAEDYPFTPRYGAVWCLNRADGYPAASVGLETIQLSHGQLHNNVELVEAPLDVVTANPDAKFRAFVHREPGDPGRYDIAEAQRAMNRAKQGHTLILVGESDRFRCNDPYSLTNRDILGG